MTDSDLSEGAAVQSKSLHISFYGRLETVKVPRGVLRGTGKGNYQGINYRLPIP